MSAQKQIGAFTLLELSIVLALIGVIIGMGLVTLTASLQASQYNTTVARMNAIEGALLNFSAAYNRIPCPADLTLIPNNATTGTHYATTAGADYGLEAGADTKSSIGVGTGVCAGTNMTPQANFTSTSGVAEGAVPTRALQLPDEYMYDGWNHRFSYAVDPSGTVAGSTPSTTLSCSPITINDSTGAVRSAAAIYAIVSHGANGHGAYTSGGVPINAGSTNTSEWTNCHCNATGASQGYPWGSPVPATPTYVQAAPFIVTAGSPLTAFDDIVAFKESWQMQTPNNPVTSNFMYIADTENSLVREVSATQAGIITTVAGGGASNPGDGGPATSALLRPFGVAVDSSGNLYIADGFTNRIRKVTAATGIITTVAGNGTAGHTGDTGAATSAELNDPEYVTLDSAGNLYIADSGNNCIRKVTAATGIITTVAGHTTGGLCDASAGAFSGDGGLATSAKLNQAMDVAVDLAGDLYIADHANMRVRKVTAATGIITTIAGNGGNACTGSGGAPTSAQLWSPQAILLDSSNNIYIGTSACTNGIWKITAATGLITTVATGGMTISGLALDNSGNFYIAGYLPNNYIRKITPSGAVCNVAGNGTTSYSGDGGPATSAGVFWPFGVAVFPSAAVSTR